MGEHAPPFWLSLVPFTTARMGENHFAKIPTAVDGVVLLAAAVAYCIQQTTIVSLEGPTSALHLAVGRDRAFAPRRRAREGVPAGPRRNLEG